MSFPGKGSKDYEGGDDEDEDDVADFLEGFAAFLLRLGWLVAYYDEGEGCEDEDVEEDRGEGGEDDRSGWFGGEAGVFEIGSEVVVSEVRIVRGKRRHGRRNEY